MRFLVLAFAMVTLGQPPGPYSGDWTADFQGTTYVRLALQENAGTPQGTMSIGRTIHVDKQGNVDAVSEAESTLKPMLNVRRSGDVLSFAYPDGDEPTRFELRLIDTNTAELRMLISEEDRQELAADGIPLPRPFRLVRSR